jgi:hypothetical protein
MHKQIYILLKSHWRCTEPNPTTIFTRRDANIKVFLYLDSRWNDKSSKNSHTAHSKETYRLLSS